jgi:hypothetical protein
LNSAICSTSIGSRLAFLQKNQSILEPKADQQILEDLASLKGIFPNDHG